MKRLFVRFISQVVLISYLTSVLRLDYSFASETEYITLASSSHDKKPPVLVLRLKPSPSSREEALVGDIQLKAKRKEVFLNQPKQSHSPQSGIEIKLTEKASSDSGAKGKILYKLFMADNFPFTDSFMSQYGLRPVLEAGKVIGLCWKLNELPGMGIVIGRDGSLVVSGGTNRLNTIRISSSSHIYLHNFMAASVHLKSQSLTLGDNVSLTKAVIDLKDSKPSGLINEGSTVNIAELSLLKGNLSNYGTLRSIGYQALHLEKGTTFINHHQLAADSYVAFSGDGYLENKGHIISPILRGKVGVLDNYGKIQSLDIDVVMLGALMNRGLIAAEKILLTCLTNTLYNQGTIKGEQEYHLIALKRLFNGGKITGTAGKITCLQEEIVNEGVIHQVTLMGPIFQNKEKGVLKGGSVDVIRGENLGVIAGEGLTLNKGAFTNKGTFVVHSLLGSGHFYNEGKLVFRGTPQNRSQLGIKSFINQGVIGKDALIEGEAVTILPTLHRLILKNGKVTIENLLIEGGNPNAIHENWAAFIVGRLTMNQLNFENHGDIVVKDAFSGKVTFSNKKNLGVQGESSLKEGTLLNQGKVVFAEKAEIGIVHNQKSFTAQKGLVTDTFSNTDKALIQKRFILNKEFENTGRLDFLSAVIHVFNHSLWNKGILFLQRVMNEEDTLGFYNEGTLCFEGGGQFGTIKNTGRVEFNRGNYFFRQWINHKDVFLFGDSWRVEGETSNKAHNQIKIRRLENNGHITAENKVVYGYGDLNPTGWEAQTFVFKLPKQTLSLSNLAGINASRLEVETANFEVNQASTILIPHLLLTLTGYFLVNKDFSVQTLEVDAEGDFHCGNSNENMARLITQGPLTIHAATIDARFARIVGKGKTLLRATQKNVFVGETKVVRESIQCVSTTKRPIYFDKNVLNGAYVVSEAELSIESLVANIYNKSDILSYGFLTLKVNPTTGLVHSQYGKIISFRDITVSGKAFAIARSFPVLIKPPRQPNFKQLDYLMCLEDTPLLQSSANIHFNTAEVVNQAADIYASKSIYHQGKEVAEQRKFNLTSTFKITSMRQHTYVHFNNKFGVEDYYVNNLEDVKARVIGGETVSINASDIHLEGMVNGFIVHFNANNFTAKNVGGPRQQLTYAPYLLLDLGKYAKSLYGPNGFIKTLSDGTITTDMPMSGGLIPLPNQQLYIIDNDASMPSLNPNSLQHFLIEPLPLQFILHQALAYYSGRLNIEGRRGEALNQYLLENAKELIEEHGSPVLPEKALKEIKKSFLAFKIDPQDPSKKASAVLALIKEDMNQYQSSADISSHTTVDIHTEESQSHYGSRIIGRTGVSATSAGTFEAISTVTTNITYEGNKRVTRDTLEHQQVLSSPEGSTTISGDKGLSITAAHLSSQGDTTLASKEGDIKEHPAILKKTIEEPHTKRSKTGKKKSRTHTETHHTIIPNTIVSHKGSIIRKLGSAAATATIEGTQNAAGQDILFQSEGVYDISGVVAHDTTTTTTSKKGTFSRQWKYEHTSTPVFCQALLAAAGKIHFDQNKSATLRGTIVQSPALINDTVEGLEAQPLVGLHHQIIQTTQKGAVSGMRVKVDSGQEIMFPSVLDVKEILTEGSSLKLTSVDWDKEQTEIMGMYEEAIQHLDSWHHVHVKKTGVPPQVLAIGAVAFTVMSSGGTTLFSTLKSYIAGRATMGQVAATTFNVICKSAGAKFIASGGDIDATFKSTFSRETFKSLAMSLAAEGILDGLDVVSPEGYAKFGDIAEYSAYKSLVESGVSTTFGQQSLKETIHSAGLNFIVDVLGRCGAQEIGKAYGGFTDDGEIDLTGPKINFIEHKLLHGALGAGLGALRGDSVAGALGGLISELVGDTFKEKEEIIAERVQEKAEEQGIKPGTEKYENLVRAEVKSTMDWSKIAAASVTALAGRDINVGLETATNALEHNFLPMLVAGVIIAAEVASWGMTVYNSYNAYEEEGMGAAVESLGADLLMGAATGGAWKLAAKGGKSAWVYAKGALSKGGKSGVSRQVSALTDSALSSASAKPSSGASTIDALGLESMGSADLTKIPVGRNGHVLKVIVKNSPTTINGTKFTGHALDQMQSRGIISPSAVMDVIKNPLKILAGNTPGTTAFIKENLKVVTNKSGDIVTVITQ